MKPKIVGYNLHRLKPDDEFFTTEVKLNELFNTYNNSPYSVWDYLLGTKADNSHRPIRELTSEESKLVATTIQWLGTPVGIHFLEEAGFEKK